MTDRPVVIAAAAALAIVLAACAALPPRGTRGTMPPPGPNGEVDPSAVPDFVAVAGPVGIAGYVAKEAVLGGADRTWPVYGDDLRTVVGQLVPGRGFVPAGVDPGAIPTFRVEVGPASPNVGQAPGSVRAYVRNAGVVDTWVAVLTAGQVQPGGAGFPGSGYIGVGCMQVPDGSQLVLLDRSPADARATARRVLFVGDATGQPASLWVDVESDGEVQVGSGMPGWWSGGAPPC